MAIDAPVWPVGRATYSEACRICGSSGPHSLFVVREMMIGLREQFDYFQCSVCRCLQLKEIPGNLSRYYQGDYYSLQPQQERAWIRQRLEILRDEHELHGVGLVGKVLARRFPSLALRALRPLAPSKTSRILDVGCGAGILLLTLARIGFKNVTGIEPFLEGDIHYREGPRIYSRALAEVSGSWDVIMFNHSWEHMAYPAETLQKTCQLLASSGTCIVRIPIIDSYAWRTYGVNWYQIDAPRHLFLHSKRSVEIVAAKSGLRIDAVSYDSGAAQFWASEQYRNDIPLRDSRSYYTARRSSIFSRREIAEFTRHAARLNAMQDGDQAVFYLRKNQEAAS